MYQISAHLKGGYQEPADLGLAVADWFRNPSILNATYASAATADAAAKASYLGPDVDGREVIWDIEEVA